MATTWTDAARPAVVKARDLRRPAAAIVGMVAALSQDWDAMDADDRRACLDTIDRHVGRLNAMVASLVDDGDSTAF